MSNFRTAVQVGAHSIWVEADDFADYMKTVSALTEMGTRLTDDARIRVRGTDDFTFFEFYSPSLGASKSLTQLKDKKAVFGFALKHTTPWIKVVRSDDGITYYGGYDKYIPYGMADNGFEKPNVFYPLLMDGNSPKRDSSNNYAVAKGKTILFT